MATAANLTEQYSISEARTGSIRVSRLALTGWGAAPTASAGLKAWSEQGRMWGVFTYSSANAGDFSLRRRGPGQYDSTDEVCSGTVADGKVTLSADNTSGISGTCDVDDGTPGTNPQADATFDVVVGYADENNLAAMMAQASKMLNSSAYPGGAASTRFERLLVDSKGELDRWLLNNFHDRLKFDTYGRPLLAHIVNIGDLCRVQSLIAMHMWNLHRANLQPEFLELADTFMQRANEAFSRLSLRFDYERDGVTDRNEFAHLVQVRRS